MLLAITSPFVALSASLHIVTYCNTIIQRIGRTITIAGKAEMRTLVNTSVAFISRSTSVMYLEKRKIESSTKIWRWKLSQVWLARDQIIRSDLVFNFKIFEDFKPGLSSSHGCVALKIV